MSRFGGINQNMAGMYVGQKPQATPPLTVQVPESSVASLAFTPGARSGTASRTMPDAKAMLTRKAQVGARSTDSWEREDGRAQGSLRRRSIPVIKSLFTESRPVCATSSAFLILS
jgi:hypothetical protein